jgi:hypothetical protein
MHISGHHNCGSEHLIADPFLGGDRFAGQRMLVDHRHTLDDDNVHRRHLACRAFDD